MEAAAATICNCRVSSLSPSFSGNNIKHFTKLSGNQLGSLKFVKQCRNKRGLAATGCVALGSGSVPQLEKQLEAEMKTEEEEEEEWLKMGNLRGGNCCKERKGMVELLECLEREAIMGDDEGKEPTDYNRRAQIFDKSSRVFQALKERSSSSTSNSAH